MASPFPVSRDSLSSHLQTAFKQFYYDTQQKQLDLETAAKKTKALIEVTLTDSVKYLNLSYITPAGAFTKEGVFSILNSVYQRGKQAETGRDVTLRDKGGALRKAAEQVRGIYNLLATPTPVEDLVKELIDSSKINPDKAKILVQRLSIAVHRCLIHEEQLRISITETGELNEVGVRNVLAAVGGVLDSSDKLKEFLCRLDANEINQMREAVEVARKRYKQAFLVAAPQATPAPIAPSAPIQALVASPADEESK